MKQNHYKLFAKSLKQSIASLKVLIIALIFEPKTLLEFALHKRNSDGSWIQFHTGLKKIVRFRNPSTAQ